jgi:hypothetical protein
MGEREDILRRFAERVRDGRWAVDTGYKSVHQAARAALRDAEACPPDDAQQRLDQIAEQIVKADSFLADMEYPGDPCDSINFARPHLVQALRLARGESAS